MFSLQEDFTLEKFVQENIFPFSGRFNVLDSEFLSFQKSKLDSKLVVRNYQCVPDHSYFKLCVTAFGRRRTEAFSDW